MATKKTDVKETAVKEAVKAPVKEVAKEVAKEAVKEAPKAEVKEEAKKAPAKKAPAKKAATKTAAPKATKAAKEETELFVQYAGNEASTADIIAKVKAAYVAEGHKESAIKAIKLYIKPEEYAAYYVINDKASGKVTLF